MVKYLNAVMFFKEDANPLLRSSLTEDLIHLTTYDAAVFVQQHFTLENLRLNTEEAKLALLIRAANFSIIRETRTNNVPRLGRCFCTSLKRGTSQST